ncbi:MAG: Aminomethyltransferase [Fimbriimonadales bacterium]|nr:Aminomethyltransferase [Fimbriimonadales bacterium]
MAGDARLASTPTPMPRRDTTSSKTLVPSEEIAVEYRALREDCVRFLPTWLKALSIAGEDRKAWLQGQVTNDLRDFEAGSHLDACVLTPTGQVVSAISLWALEDRFIALVPEGRFDATVERLDRMLILEDVVLEGIAGHRIISVQGPNASRALSQATELPRLSAGPGSGAMEPCLFLRHDATGSGGWTVICPEEQFTTLEEALATTAACSEATFDVARLEAGIPRNAFDYDENTLAMELGPAFVEANVSFTKGCYTGQEVVHRIYSRGHVNRTWMGLRCDGAVSRGDRIRAAAREDAGKVTSVGWSPESGFIAGALLRREAAVPGTAVTVVSESGPVQARVEHFPLRGR